MPALLAAFIKKSSTPDGASVAFGHSGDFGGGGEVWTAALDGSGREIVGFFAELRGMSGLGRADELADRFEADLDRPLGKLSRGNRTRAAKLLGMSFGIQRIQAAIAPDHGFT